MYQSNNSLAKSSFFVISVIFILWVLGIKVFELGYWTSQGYDFSSLWRFMAENVISVGFQLTVVFLVFRILRCFSARAAIIVSAVLLCLLSYSELCLCIYSSQTGILMGRELLFRPVNEQVETVLSFIRWKEVIATIVYFSLFIFLSVWLTKKEFNIGKKVSVVFFVLLIVLSFLFFFVKPSHNVAFSNKIWECVRACVSSKEYWLWNKEKTGNSQREYSEEETKKMIEEYQSIYPDRALDDQFLLERANQIPNVLSSYFKENGGQKPNVVVIVVESLGADLFGINSDGACFTPFLDSLSKHSLLWTNCLSTTPRSFGAVPAITGSVPHGQKGFQFGDIPSHNSLLSILKSDGYSTNAFYAGNFSFDRVYDYLVAQNIDYLSPFYEEYKSTPREERDGTYWGFNDDELFRKSLTEISKRDASKPFVDLYVTITQHEDLELLDKEQEKEFYEIAEKKVRSCNHKDSQTFRTKVGKLASTLYTDASLRRLIQGYADLGLAENTIFVITGDHSLNLHPQNPLDAYHVPLIIWSPLLQKPQHFRSVVSHSDITPSLVSLLENTYGLPKNEKVHWVSDGLDTNVQFNSQVHTYFLRYSREIVDGVFGNYYYTEENGESEISEIRDSMYVSAVTDTERAKQIEAQFRAITFVENEVYKKNLLTSNPIYSLKQYTACFSTKIPNLSCISPQQKPSVAGRTFATIFENHVHTSQKKIKFQLQAEMLYTGEVWQDQFISLVLTCKGEDFSIFNEDYISKYIQKSSYKPDEWNNILFTKTISLNGLTDFDYKLYLTSTHKDDVWNPEHGVYLKNIQLTIFESND